MVLVLGVSVSLAFYRINSRPLIAMAESAYKYWRGSKLYIWKKENKPVAPTPDNVVREAKNYASIMVPKIADSKLKDLTWSLDIKESIYSDKKQR